MVLITVRWEITTNRSCVSSHKSSCNDNHGGYCDAQKRTYIQIGAFSVNIWFFLISLSSILPLSFSSPFPRIALSMTEKNLSNQTVYFSVTSFSLSPFLPSAPQSTHIHYRFQLSINICTHNHYAPFPSVFHEIRFIIIKFYLQSLEAYALLPVMMLFGRFNYTANVK
jgi:hypothetical protein